MFPRIPDHHKSCKVRWSTEEDRLLAQSIEIHGTLNWTLVANSIPGRTGKQCRERWVNQLNPQLNFEVWTPEEDSCLMSLVALHGRHWSLITQFLPGRSVNSTKNRFTFLIKHGASSGLQLSPELVPSLRPEPQPAPELMAPVTKFKLPPIGIIPLEPRAALFFTL
jgi:hypothetical protein